MKIKLLLISLLATQLSYGQSIFSKGIAKLAKVVGSLSATTVSTLDNVSPLVCIGSNLHSDKVGSLDQAMLPNYKTGGDAVTVWLSQNNKPGFCKVDGKVTIDGKPVEYSGGLYAQVSEPSTAPRVVEITTTSGQKASFTIEPSKKHIKLLSINGQKEDNVSVDLTKDVVLELDYPESLKNELLKVSLVITQINLKGFNEVCYVKGGSKITIPAAAFRNINILPASNLLFSYKNCYIIVETEGIENATNVSGSFPSVQYKASYTDGKFITVTKEPVLNKGLTFKGKDDKAQMEYNFFKPSAFLSRPFEQIKVIGLNSFAIRGTTFHQSTKTSETSTQTITTTTTLSFPKQPNEVWDALLEKLYPDFIAIVQSEFNATVLPVEKVTRTEAYKSIEAYAKDDINTKVEFSRAFRDTKVISAFMPVAEGYGANGVAERVMKESGANALLSMTVDLEISSAGEKIIMVPKFAFELNGKVNGTTVNTKYCTGTITGKSGVPVLVEMKPADIEKLVQKSDLLMIFRKGLQELKAKEKENGDYTTVWNLRK